MAAIFLLAFCFHLLGQYDVIVYRATPAGISAAVTIHREGAKVLIIEPSHRPGGMMTNGLSASDVCFTWVIGGFAREFFEKIGEKYGRRIGWRFEPKVAQMIFSAYLKDIPVKYSERIVKANVSKKKLRSVVTNNGSTYSANIFIDASYEGDLMALAGVTYRVGREAKHEYEESLAGFRINSVRDQFPESLKARDTKNRLLSGVKKIEIPETGSGDRGVMAYNYRLCVTRKRSNRVKFKRPKHYTRRSYELLGEYIQKKPVTRIRELFHFLSIPNQKFDLNNFGPFSTNWVGHSWTYPEASSEERRRIEIKHKLYTQGLLYFLSHDTAVPQRIRRKIRIFGLCKD
ncbi:MAG: FAD-dependent oxidoreductase, partial [Deltaproteobacteria bacterium]|nr:FAD-dependent oxidoreductase [Deltaproteobacteria bacterium]